MNAKGHGGPVALERLDLVVMGENGFVRSRAEPCRVAIQGEQRLVVALVPTRQPQLRPPDRLPSREHGLFSLSCPPDSDQGFSAQETEERWVCQPASCR